MELSKNVIKFVIGVLLTIIGFFASHSLYFSAQPLFGIPFFGQTLFAFAFGAFGILVLPVLAITIVAWFESVIAKTAIRVVSDFWEQQSKKLQEAKRKREEEHEKDLEEKEKQQERIFKERAILLDTSAIIDGRILDIVKCGFLDNPLIVPREVLDELQLISDSSDALKRQRGRRGLDIVKDLKKATRVVISDKNVDEKEKGSEGVDKALLKIAKKLNASIATVDFNLNKVASVSGIKVLNVNDLANAIKTVVLPGETMSIKVVQSGKEKSQGVGYLPDGTMIVVEDGGDILGREATVVVSRVIQSAAGKMIFGRKG